MLDFFFMNTIAQADMEKFAVLRRRSGEILGPSSATIHRQDQQNLRTGCLPNTIRRDGRQQERAHTDGGQGGGVPFKRRVEEQMGAHAGHRKARLRPACQQTKYQPNPLWPREAPHHRKNGRTQRHQPTMEKNIKINSSFGLVFCGTGRGGLSSKEPHNRCKTATVFDSLRSFL